MFGRAFELLGGHFCWARQFWPNKRGKDILQLLARVCLVCQSSPLLYTFMHQAILLYLKLITPHFSGIPQIPNLNSLQAYTGWYWIFIVTILATYSGNLMSFLAVQRPPLPINSLEELVQNPDWEADMYSGTSALDLFKVWNLAPSIIFEPSCPHSWWVDDFCLSVDQSVIQIASV